MCACVAFRAVAEPWFASEVGGPQHPVPGEGGGGEAGGRGFDRVAGGGISGQLTWVTYKRVRRAEAVGARGEGQGQGQGPRGRGVDGAVLVLVLVLRGMGPMTAR
jgi:hypothetical protein